MGTVIAPAGSVADDSSSYDRMPVMLGAVLGLFVLGGIVATRWAPLPGRPPSALADLSGAQLVEVRDASGRTVLSGDFRERVNSLGNPKRDAALADRHGRRVIGEVEIELPGPQSMTGAQELEIDIIELSPSAKYSVFIDDREVAAFTTDDRGSVDMELEFVPGRSGPH
jgi:hypothetical protein